MQNNHQNTKSPVKKILETIKHAFLSSSFPLTECILAQPFPLWTKNPYSISWSSQQFLKAEAWLMRTSTSEPSSCRKPHRNRSDYIVWTSYRWVLQSVGKFQKLKSICWDEGAFSIWSQKYKLGWWWRWACTESKLCHVYVLNPFDFIVKSICH